MTALPLPFRALFLLLMGCGGLAVAIVVPTLTTKSAAFAGAGLLAVVALIMSGRPKEVLLAGYIVALTYNRQYFGFDWLTGDQGNQGLFWIPADLFFGGLLAVWVFERAARVDAPLVPRGPVVVAALPVLAFFVPFVISALLAERPDWAANETARVLRFLIVLVWMHSNMNRSLWITAVAALGVAIFLQAALGTVQVVLKADRNLLSVFGVAGEVVLNADGEVDQIENRARGTLGHPNYLAPYVMMFVPAMLGGFLYARDRRLRLLLLALLAVALAGLVASKSRAPIAFGVLGLLGIAAIAVKERVLSLKLALGALVIALVLTAAAAIPFAEAIRERIVGDFSESVTIRTKYNGTALQVWDEAPLFGIGPNNGIIGLKRHSALFAWLNADLEAKSEGLAVRAVAPVHNLYLLILSETGLAGLTGFVVLLLTVLWRAVSAGLHTAGPVRGMCFGLAVGFALQLVQQTIDFSLWGDPSWYTFGVLAALVGTAPALAPATRPEVVA